MAPVVRNRWRDALPVAGSVTEPRLTATVVLAADASDDVDVALADQSYPGRLVDVARISADVDTAAARRAAAASSSADVLVFIGDGCVPQPAFLDALLQWHHDRADAVTLATPAPGDGAEHADEDWLSRMTRSTDDLNKAGFQAFRGCAQRSFAVRRALFDEAGGIDPAIGPGWQPELAYRLAQRGALFVPVAGAVERRGSPAEPIADELPASAAAAMVDRIPLLPQRQAADATARPTVPLVDVVIEAGRATADAVRETVNGVLSGDLADLVVSVSPAAAELVDIEQLRAADDRVQPAGAIAVTSFPTPFRLAIPAGCTLRPGAAGGLLGRLQRGQLGLVQALVEPRNGDAQPLVVRLTRTAVVERALRSGDGAAFDDLVDRISGSLWVDGSMFGLRLER